MTTLTPEQMADLLEEEEQRAPAPAAGRLTPEQMAGLLPDLDDEMSLGNIGRQALSGITFGFDDEIVAGVGSLFGDSKYKDLVREERARKKAFEKKNPYTSFGLKAAGAIAGSLIPVSWVARGLGAGARTTQAIQAASPLYPIRGSMAAGASLPSALRAGAEIGAKATGYQLVGDEEGNALERLGNIASRPAETGTALAFGAAVGAPFGYLGRSMANINDDVSRGVGAQASGARRIQQAMADDSRSVADVMADLTHGVGPRHMDDAARRAVVERYADALQNGAGGAAAREQALNAYMQTGPNYHGLPISRSTAKGHVRDVLNRIDDEFQMDARPNARTRGEALPDEQTLMPRMMAAERLSGADAPMRGSLRNLTETVTNLPETRGIMDNVLEARQQGSIGRARRNIRQNIGEEDYTQYVRDLQRQTMEDFAPEYGRIYRTARSFDLRPVLAQAEARSASMAGDAFRETNRAIRDVGDWIQRLEQSPGLTPEQLLRGYRQLRSAMNERIQKIGSRAAGTDYSADGARALRQLRDDLDRVAFDANPEFGQITRQRADRFQIEEAADMGRNLNLNEGAALQEARDWLDTLPAQSFERDAFMRGFSRRLLDELAGKEPTHDIAKTYLKGGGESINEGVSGVVRRLFNTQKKAGREQFDSFMRRFQRERAAMSSQRLNKGSQTGRLLDESRAKQVAQRLLRTLQYGVNPLAIIEDLAAQGALKASEAQNRQIARRLSTQSLPDLIQLLREIDRTSPDAVDPNFLQQLIINGQLAGGMASQAPGAIMNLE